MPADADGNGLRVFALTDEGTAKPSVLLKGDAIVAIATVAIGNIPYDDVRCSRLSTGLCCPRKVLLGFTPVTGLRSN
jgi:hypothetical protein